MNKETLEGTTEVSQYLTFTLAGEEYGIDLLRVQEIRGYSKTTRVPNSPPEVLGVLNLRGTIVPIVDLRRRFGLGSGEYDGYSVIVVVMVQDRVMGMVVDSVSEVMTIPQGHIQPSSDGRASNRFLQGIATVEDQLVILLDVDAVLLDMDVSEAAA